MRNLERDCMKHLHTLASPIVHGSLNAGKLFVSRDGTTKIGEFGLAALCHPVAALVPSVNLAGLSRWLSPELIDFGDGDVAKPTKASDVWALGCTLFEIATEKLPYSRHKHDVKIQQQILEGHPPGCRDNKTNPSYLDSMWPLMESCWLPSPSDRPTIPMLVKLFEETYADIRAGIQPPVKSPDPPLSVYLGSPPKPQPGQALKSKRIRHALNLFQPVYN
ncbi:hypothetical protein FRC12_016613 [Ceratobasidium sp. 428]|nr:hypothetical protein FRC12_016613 [Ceratobasidium sp. 428]